MRLRKQTCVFHIISNDSGFDGLVDHLNRLGRSCKKVTTKAVKPEQEPLVLLSEGASLVVERLKQLDGSKRPRKKTTLINWIKSQCRGFENGSPPEDVCKELVGAKLIRESGSDVAYGIEH